jgi:hypothetical protein
MSTNSLQKIKRDKIKVREMMELIAMIGKQAPVRKNVFRSA